MEAAPVGLEVKIGEGSTTPLGLTLKATGGHRRIADVQHEGLRFGCEGRDLGTPPGAATELRRDVALVVLD